MARPKKYETAAERAAAHREVRNALQQDAALLKDQFVKLENEHARLSDKSVSALMTLQDALRGVESLIAYRAAIIRAIALLESY